MSLSTPVHNGTETSQAAAYSMRTAAGRIRQRIYLFIWDQRQRGATREEIEKALEIEGNTVRPRVRELIDLDMVVETSRKRDTESGRQAFILVAKHYHTGVSNA